MPADYDIYILAPDSDTTLAHLGWGASADAAATGRKRKSILWLEYTKVTHGVGSFRLGLPYPQFDVSLARLDARLVVWRKPPGGHRYLDFAGFIRTDPADFYQRGNGMYVELRGPCCNHLLKRCEIAYKAGTAGASKSGAADDIMKAFVRENIGAVASGARTTLPSCVTVQSDNSLGTLISKAASHRNLLDVLREIADDSHKTESTATYFGMVPLGSGWSMEFRTRIGQWGNDHRHPNGPSGVTGAQGSVVVALERGNFGNASLAQDRIDEITVAYGLGQGEGVARNVQTASDTTRCGASPLNRIESSINANNSSSDAEVLAAAQARLREGRPRRSFSGQLVETPATRYGVEWWDGDYLTAMFTNRIMDVRVDAVTVKVADRTETISAQVQSES